MQATLGERIGQRVGSLSLAESTQERVGSLSLAESTQAAAWGRRVGSLALWEGAGEGESGEGPVDKEEVSAIRVDIRVRAT